MIKALKKALVLVLSLIIVIGGALNVGCDCNGKKESDASIIEEGRIDYNDIDVDYSYMQGLHSFKVKTEKNDKFVKNGSTEYSLVIPKNSSKYEQLGVAELNKYFSEATGVIFPVLTDDKVSFSGESRYICIGEVSFLEDAGIRVSDNFGFDGYIVKTSGKSVFLGGGLYSAPYAVYEFLKWTVGFEYFIDDCYTLNRGVKDINFIDFDIKEKPDIESRSKGYGNITSSEMAMRMKYSYESVFANVDGRTHHTSFLYISPEEYGDTHPEYFNANKTQLSYTANGNPEAVEEMREIVFEKLKTIATIYPNVSSVEFTQQDNNDWSDKDISAYKSKYGSASPAASQIIFINPVAKKFGEWLKTEYPGRKFTIVIFAYLRSVDPPTKIENGKYVPIDEEIVLEDNVGVFYAPIEMDFTKTHEAEINVNVKNNFEKWSAVCKRLYLWSYSVYFGNYFMPYNTLDCVQPFYKFAFNNNACYIFDEGAYSTGPTSAWNGLKAYVHGQIMWNTEYKVETLIEKYFNNVYAEAGERMYEIFNSFRLWYEVCRSMEAPIGGTSSCLSANSLNRKYWPKGILEDWIEMYDEAFEAIQKYKTTDEKYYNTLYNRIALESASPRYLNLYFYSGTMSAVIHDKMVDELCKDIERIGIIQLAEEVKTDDLRFTL